MKDHRKGEGGRFKDWLEVRQLGGLGYAWHRSCVLKVLWYMGMEDRTPNSPHMLEMLPWAAGSTVLSSYNALITSLEGQSTR